jgi:hypothetical protein
MEEDEVLLVCIGIYDLAYMSAKMIEKKIPQF